MQITQSVNVDGWTKNDLIYIWKDKGALQFAGKLLPLQITLQPGGKTICSGNLSLPGGFKMANSSNKYCDVATATGRLKFPINQSFNSFPILAFNLLSSWNCGRASFNALYPCQGSTAASKWTWSLPESFPSTS